MSNTQPATSQPNQKLKVKNAKAADPGVSFVLETADGQPFDAPITIFLCVTYTAVHGGEKTVFNSSVTIEDTVADHLISVILPFGDAAWKHQINLTANEPEEYPAGGFNFHLDVTVHEMGQPYLSYFDLQTAQNTIAISPGYFHVSTDPTAP